MSRLTLYTNPQSRGRIVHWMMEEVGEPYETVWLEYGPSMSTDSYLAINPMGKVPAVTDGDAVVTETAAICAYLADRFPDKHLLPAVADHVGRAAYFRWLFFAAGPVEQAVTARSMNWAVPEDKKGMVGFGSFENTINALELALQPGPYLCGEQFSAADVYVGSHLNWGMLFGSIEKRPVFEAYVQRLLARPAAQRADALNDAYVQTRA